VFVDNGGIVIPKPFDEVASPEASDITGANLTVDGGTNA
jgi:hypothetical protein